MFNATYQALLARGIAVFAPNVRGSSGFGKRFVNLDNGPLRFDGRPRHQGLRRLRRRGGRRRPRSGSGIMGGSYGGYMTMAGLTEYPDLFAAGANLFGIVNFETFFAETEPWMAAISKVEYGDPDTAGRPAPPPLADPPDRPGPGRDPGPPRGQRHERAGGRGRAGRGEPEGPGRAGRVRAVPRRGPRLPQAAEPRPLGGRDRRLVRGAPQGEIGAEGLPVAGSLQEEAQRSADVRGYPLSYRRDYRPGGHP